MKNNMGIQFKRVLIQGMKNLLRNKMMIFASLLVTVVTMIVIGTCYCITQNINSIFDSFMNKEFSLSVFLNSDISDEEAAAFGNILKVDSRVKSYQYISKKQAFDNYKSRFPEEYFDVVFENKSNDFLPVSFNIVLNDISKTNELQEYLDTITYKSARIEPGEDIEPELSVVKEFSSTEAVMDKMSKAKNIVYTVGVGITVALMFFAVIIISNTIMLSVFARKTEIEIMNYVGATKWYIEGPYIVEGCVIGFVGAVISFFVLKGLYGMLANLVSKSLVFTDRYGVSLLGYRELSTTLFLGFILIGIVIGSLGAMISSGRNIRN